MSSDFRGWFINQTVSDTVEHTTFVDAWHSVYDSEFGESDIEFGVPDGDDRDILVLIENKIDAELQENQLQRYQKRGKKAVENEWDDFYTCLFAPESYLDPTAETDVVDETVSYEAVRDRLANRDTQRAEYRSQMLANAIEQARRGYVSEPDEQATSFRHGYWNIAHDEFSELEMDEPIGVAAGNSWERFNPSVLPNDVELVHKMDRGVVDLTFGGRADQEDEFRTRYEPLLDSEMEIVETGKSQSVRLSVPTLEWKDDPITQTGEVRHGLRAASRLLGWYQQVQDNPASYVEHAIDQIITVDEEILAELDDSYYEIAVDIREHH